MTRFPCLTMYCRRSWLPKPAIVGDAGQQPAKADSRIWAIKNYAPPIPPRFRPTRAARHYVPPIPPFKAEVADYMPPPPQEFENWTEDVYAPPSPIHRAQYPGWGRRPHKDCQLQRFLREKNMPTQKITPSVQFCHPSAVKHPAQKNIPAIQLQALQTMPQPKSSDAPSTDNRSSPQLPNFNSEAWKIDAIAHQAEVLCNQYPDQVPLRPPVLAGDRLSYITKDGRPLCLGSGCSGSVFAASLEGIQQPVVVKLFRSGGGENVRGIIIEAAKLSALNGCASSPRCYGLAVLNNSPGFMALAIVMELVGEPSSCQTMTLADLLDVLAKDPKGLPMPNWPEFCLRLTNKLAKAHQRGIIFNDIKTDNIMLRWKGATWHPVLVDVGNACYRDRSVSYGVARGREEEVLRKYPQLAPETVWQNYCDEKSDVYSLGLVLSHISHFSRARSLLDIVAKRCRSESPALRFDTEELKTIFQYINLHGQIDA